MFFISDNYCYNLKIHLKLKFKFNFIIQSKEKTIFFLQFVECPDENFVFQGQQRWMSFAGS